MQQRVTTKNLTVTDKTCLDGRVYMHGEMTSTGNITIASDGELNVYGTLNLCNANVIQPKLQSIPMQQSDINRRSLNGEESERYDIVICGAGTAGSLLVYRLAEQYPTAKILVLEAGKDDVQDNETVRTPQDGPNPNQYDANPLLTDDWGQLPRTIFSALGEGAFAIQQSQRSLSTDQSIPQQKILGMARGMTLGGTSAINAAIWNRGTKQGTYDKWEAATGSSDFGWAAMNESFKKIENRSQQTRYYGQPIPMWLPPATPMVPPAAKFNPAYHGDQGRINLYQPVLPGYVNQAVTEIAAAGLGGRSLPVGLDAEDPNNPAEGVVPTPTTFYDQSNPNFSAFNPAFANNFNPYPATTPGLTYVPPNPAGTTRGPEFAGAVPAKLDGTPVILGRSNLKKGLTARCFAAPAFVYPLQYPVGNPAVPNNVTIKTKVYVTKLVFSETNPTECIGVEYVENGWHVANVARAIRRDVKPWVSTFSNVDRSLCTEEQAKINQAVALAGGIKRAYSRTDVWVCMGALDSPALLQRSGVGPKEVLEGLNYSPVKCILDLPGVGRGLQDSCDVAIAGVNEVDYNTYLPAYTGAPASGAVTTYMQVFGAADPADPNDIVGSSSIGGAAVGYGFESARMRVKSSPGKERFDFDIITGDYHAAAFVPFGNVLWDDIARYLQNNRTTVKVSDPKVSFANYDRSKMGQYTFPGTFDYSFALNNEYWNAQSKGEVLITSGNVFDRPNYAPNMLSNENDLEAFENHWENNIIPLLSALSRKKRGPRGPFSYAFVVGTGGHVATTTQVQLGASVAATLFKQFAPAYVVSQGNYDLPNGVMIGATVTMASGAAAIPGNNQRKIIAWSGNTGVAATSYVATVAAFAGLPTAGDQYSLALATELPLDSVEFNGDNNRNFVRISGGGGDLMYSDLMVQTLANDPLTTFVGSTRVTVSYPGHGFAVGEMIKISGVSGPVDTIAAKEFNDYHVVDAVVDANNFQIVLFWNKTAKPGTTGTPPTPSPAASAVGIVGTGGAGITVHTLKFDKIKFREYAFYSYFSGWHPASSCRMGKPTDSMAVVDTRGRVYNTMGLRVCDASIFPTKPDANTQAPTYGVAQRLFELVSSEEYDNYF